MKHSGLHPYVAVFLTAASLLAGSAAPAQAQWARAAQVARHTATGTRHQPDQAAPGSTASQRAARGLDRHLTPSAHRVNVVVPGQETGYNWDTNGGGWVGGWRTVYTYDTGARVTQEVQSDSATGMLQYRYQFTYNAQGLETMRLDQRYNSFTSAWENNYRSTKVYDAYGNETDYLLQRWMSGSWQTQYGYRTAYTYNTANDVTQETRREYDSATGLYQFDSRNSYAYMNSQISEVLQEEWDGTTWVNTDKIVDITWHNWPAFQPASYREQEWDGAIFVDSSRTAITYTPTSYVETQQKPTGAGGSWINSLRYSQASDMYGNFTGESQENWNVATGAWVFYRESRNLLTYGAPGTLLRDVEQRRDSSTSGQYQNSFRSNYASFQTIITGLAAENARLTQASLSPNPTTGRLTLTVPGLTAAAPGTVRDAVGRVVRTFTATPAGPAVADGGATVALDLGALPAGVYSVTLQTAAGAVTRRVVRE